MMDIAICIPTYKRPLLLDNLLASILRSDLDNSKFRNISLIIVDNDAAMTAAGVAESYKDRMTEPFSLYYSVFPVKGLANVRNELLRQAIAKRPEFILFIDDDEYAHQGWISRLVETILRCNGDMARGPVISVFADDVPGYKRCLFDRPEYLPDAAIKNLATNNLVIKTESLLKYDVWFDERFNFTGSEDSYFGSQMIRKGATLYWAADAFVYENIPEERLRIKWIMRRRYMGGANFVYKMKLDNEKIKVIKKGLISILYLFTGAAGIVLLLLPVRNRLWGLLKIAEGTGGIAGILNIRKTAY